MRVLRSLSYIAGIGFCLFTAWLLGQFAWDSQESPLFFWPAAAALVFVAGAWVGGQALFEEWC